LPSGKTATCSPASIGAGTSAVSVSANITGLSANTSYTVKLTATNGNGTTESTTTTFTTSGPKPTPVVEAPDSITETGATLKGTVNPEGSEVSSCSFEYGQSLPSGKTAACSPATIPSGTSPVAVSAAVTGLAAGTKYTFKLTATNADGTRESSTLTFETAKPAPRVVLQAPSSITETNATLNGTVNPEGSEVKSCSFEYGTSLPSGKTATCSPATIPAGTSPVSVSAAISGLSLGTSYTVKLTATNGNGTTVSTAITFETTQPTPKPTVAVEAPGSITETGATLKGTVNPEHSEVTSCMFEYGTSLPSGKTAACTPATIPAGTSPVVVSAAVTGLSAGRKYAFKLTATNSGGTNESSTVTFETTKAKPKVVVEAPSSVGESGAALTGTVNPEGSEVKTCSFEYGTSLPSGKTATCSPATIPAGTGAVSVSGALSGLTPGTSYSVKLTATNGNGTTESKTITFTTAGTAPGGGGGGVVGGVETSIITPAPGGGGVLGNKAVSPVVTLSGSPSAVSKIGAFALKLHCATGATSCNGTITLKTSKAIAAKKGKKPAVLTLATGSFSLSGGQLKSLTLHLSSTARTVLARTHVLGALAMIVARDAAAETATTKATFSLHPAKAAKKH
jgi:trimeric autotransporter adhesin